MNKSIKLMHLIPKKVKSSYSGINLIGLMISSVLGVFIISVIIKISMTINNNLQLIQAYIELEQSTRIIQKFFENIFETNGNGLEPNTRTNEYLLDSTGDNAQFSMWYVGGVTGAISCSGRKLNAQNVDNQITVFMSNPSASNKYGSITCKNAKAKPGDVDPTSSISTERMPVVNGQQVVKFFMAPIVSVPSTVTTTNGSSTPAKIRVIPIDKATTPQPTGTLVYDSVGIKLAILLRSTQKVFNVKRKVEFQKILNFSGFEFNSDDDYLYKLVIIQTLFGNNPKNASIINTKIIRS